MSFSHKTNISFINHHQFNNNKTLQEVLQDWKVGKIDPKLLSELKKEPCLFEIVPLTSGKVNFVYKIIPTKFSGRSNPSAFREMLNCQNKSITVFESLSGNLMISPTNTKKDYQHLQQFLVNADEEQEIKPFFKSWAETAEKALKDHKTVWLSTHGKNIPWLHARVDFQPKYFQTKKFKMA